MSLTSDQIKHVAKLANLPLTAEEEKTYSEQLSKILDYIEQLNQVDTRDLENTLNVTGLINITSEDNTRPCLSSEEALKNASVKKENLFITKGVFEEV